MPEADGDGEGDRETGGRRQQMEVRDGDIMVCLVKNISAPICRQNDCSFLE